MGCCEAFGARGGDDRDWLVGERLFDDEAAGVGPGAPGRVAGSVDEGQT